jgi:hypothetical protein
MSTAKQIHDLYEQDAFLWYNENAKLLREKKFELIDIENIAEEIESMGAYERDKLESFLMQLFLHILKWKYQPSRRCASWEISIKKQRRHVKRQINQNPSLKGVITEIVNHAYEDARDEAFEETSLELETFPEKMPFTFEEALQDNWLPS